MRDDRSNDLSIGERIQLHRRRRGLTQDEAAGLAGVSVSLWRKWETGARHVDRFSCLIRIAQALRVRDLRDLTGQPLTAGPDGLPHHESIGRIRPALLRHPSLIPTAAPPDVAVLARRVEAAWDAYQAPSPWRYAHAGAVLPDLITGAELAVRASPEDAGVLDAAGRVYLLARAFTKRVGEHDLALLCAERAMSIAGRATDPALFGACVWNYAQALSTRGDAAEVRTVSDDARRVLAGDATAEGATPALVSVFGALHLIGMVGAVREDDQADGQRLLAGADRAAAWLGSDRNDYRLAFGPTNVAIHRVSYSVELGHSRSAVRGAAAVDVSRAPTVERRVTHRVDVAQSYTRLREDAAALGELAEADRESPEQVLYSVTVRAMLREMLRRETPSTRPMLRPMAARLGVLA